MRKGWWHIYKYTLHWSLEREIQSHILPPNILLLSASYYCLQWIHLHRQAHHCWPHLLHLGLDSWTAGEIYLFIYFYLFFFLFLWVFDPALLFRTFLSIGVVCVCYGKYQKTR